MWDETSGEKSQVVLPEGADAPVISADGRFIAYTIQGQSYDTPDHPATEIPLWLLDRESGKAYQVASYATTATRALYPQGPNIFLMLEWLADTHRLLVQVYPEPSQQGALQPTGDLYLVDVEQRSSELLLQAGAYERISIRPDGGQIAALDTPAFNEEGDVDFDALQDGQLTLIDASTGTVTFRMPTRLHADPWAMIEPTYSPDGKYAAWNSENGFAIVNTETGELQEIALKNTCLPETCYWTDFMPVFWLPDSRSFYTLTTINDFFDERAETTLHQVFIEPEPRVETVTVIHANTWSFYFSPDRRSVSYWNQPDPDTLDTPAGRKTMNWITFYLMDLEQLEPRHYMAEFSLRNLGWSPNNQQFTASFSPQGGSNQRMVQMALGDICQPPKSIDMPRNTSYQRIRWIDEERLLAWGVSNMGSPSGEYLYFFRLGQQGEPILLGDVAPNPYEPIGGAQVVVIRR